MQEVYRRLYVSETDRQEIERYLLAELARIEGEKDRSVRSLTARRTNLEDERRRLLQAHYGGAVPLELLKEEQERLGRELAGIQRQLDAYQADAKLVRAHVEQALDLLEDCYRLYAAAPDHLRKQLNQVFFERVLVNPLVDEEGRVILPGAGTSDGANAGGPADKDAAGEETGGEDSAALSADPDPDQAGRRNTSAHDEQHSAGEEGGGTSEASGGEGADADTPALTSRPIHLADTGSGTRLSALLTPPFDQLASPSLHAAAHTHHLQHAAQLDNSTTPPAAGGTLMSSTTRTTPTLVGERCSTSGTASQPVSTGVGSGKSLLVRMRGLEPPRPAGH